jgi:hypothetical protein
VDQWTGGLVGEGEARGSGKVQRCKCGKVITSGLVGGWTSGLGERHTRGSGKVG